MGFSNEIEALMLDTKKESGIMEVIESKLSISLLSNPTYLNCQLRNMTTILLCFAAGYNGYSAIFPGYNSYPAAVVSLLLSSGLSLEMGKNLTRFQGVVMGIVIGQIAYAYLEMGKNLTRFQGVVMGIVIG